MNFIRKSITYHLGLFGNIAGLTPVVCNRPFQAVAIISVLDYQPGVTDQKYNICKSCKDLLLTGTTRGVAKANKIRSLIYKINLNLSHAKTYAGWGYTNHSDKYCDAAHKYEQELIDLYLS